MREEVNGHDVGGVGGDIHLAGLGASDVGRGGLAGVGGLGSAGGQRVVGRIGQLARRVDEVGLRDVAGLGGAGVGGAEEVTVR